MFSTPSSPSCALKEYLNLKVIEKLLKNQPIVYLLEQAQDTIRKNRSYITTTPHFRT